MGVVPIALALAACSSGASAPPAAPPPPAPVGAAKVAELVADMPIVVVGDVALTHDGFGDIAVTATEVLAGHAPLGQPLVTSVDFDTRAAVAARLAAPRFVVFMAPARDPGQYNAETALPFTGALEAQVKVAIAARH